MTIGTSNMIKWLIHLDHLFLCQLPFHALLVIILKSLTWKSIRPCCNYLPNEHIPKTERKNTKIIKSLVALLNRLQWTNNVQNILIYMWAEQYLVYDWIRLYAHCDTTRRNSLSAILCNADKGGIIWGLMFLGCHCWGHFLTIKIFFRNWTADYLGSLKRLLWFFGVWENCLSTLVPKVKEFPPKYSMCNQFVCIIINEPPCSVAW